MFLSQNAGKEAVQPSKPKTQSKKAPPKKEVPKPSESEEEDDDDDEEEEEEEEDADDVDDDGKLVMFSNPHLCRVRLYYLFFASVFHS